MSETVATLLRKSPLNSTHRALERPHGAVCRLGHAGRVFRHHRRAPGRAHARRVCSTSATWARSRLPARTRSRRCSGSPATTPAPCRSARRSTSGLLTPEGTFVDDMLVYRMAPSSLHARRQRRQRGEGLRLDQRADQAGRRCGRRRFEQPLRADLRSRGRPRARCCSR